MADDEGNPPTSSVDREMLSVCVLWHIDIVNLTGRAFHVCLVAFVHVVHFLHLGLCTMSLLLMRCSCLLWYFLNDYAVSSRSRG